MHKAPWLGPPGPCPAFQHSLPDTLVAACPKAGLVRAKRAPANISFLMRSSLSDYADCTLDRKWGGGKQYEPPSPLATSNLGASDAGDLMHKRATNEADNVVDPTTRRLLAGWLVVGLVMSVVRVHRLVVDNDARRISTQDRIVGSVVHLVVAIEDDCAFDRPATGEGTGGDVGQPEEARDAYARGGTWHIHVVEPSACGKRGEGYGWR